MWQKRPAWRLSVSTGWSLGQVRDGEDERKTFVRCEKCKNVGESAHDDYVRSCKSCYGKEIQRDERYHDWPAPALTLLPPDILLAISINLALDDGMMLRGVAKFLENFIPRPTHQELLAVEKEDWLMASSSLAVVANDFDTNSASASARSILAT